METISDSVVQPHVGFSLRRIAGDAAVIIGGSLVANAFNYLYHFLISRRLGPDDYGTLAALAAAAMIIGVVGSTVSIVAMQDTAKLWAWGQDAGVGPFVRRVAPAALCAALIVAGVTLAASFLAGPYLHIVKPSLWLTFAAYLAIAIFAGFFRGAAQGAHRFGLFAASNVADTLTKLVSALALVGAGMALLGALGGFVIGSVVGLAIVALPLVLQRGDPKILGKHDHLELGGRALSVLWISAALLMLLFMDMLFAKHALSGRDAGLYGAAGTIARTIPFGVGLIALIMGPKAAAAHHVSRESLRRLLMLSFGAGLVLSLIGLACTTFLPAQLLAFTYGPKYLDAAGLLRIYGAAAALLAIGGLGIGYLQAVGNYGITRVLIVAVLFEAGLMAAFGTSGARLLLIAIAINFVLLPAIAAYISATLRTAPQARAPLVDEPALVQ